MNRIRLSALVPLLMVAGGLAAARADTNKPPIVLVHGAWETSSIWDGVAVKLKHDGYSVQVVTLPGRPGNPMPADQVSMDSYRNAIVAAIANDREPVVLVGHSFAGFPISAVAEAEPGKIRTLVYLAAYLPQDGQSLLGVATNDKGSKAGPAVQIDKDNGISTIAPDARAGLFANDAPPEVRAMVASAIVPEPLAPLATPVHLTAKFARVDKVYIHTARDQVVSPELQAAMVAAMPVRKQQTLDTGHTPFVTDPNGVAAAIEASIG
ncbi:alpha/beta fold hydrolase [Caballeronia sp. BR00000012568055]|uniref:alpha/beta fold hydrolase n=1 Tax=Caballeronia sp. BR00000012568055 TaxID=2918761 RepID=UPI0023F835DC|nr:alpha/beta fold hydrolase [Caballeronia sp. BR00000012568055]